MKVIHAPMDFAMQPVLLVEELKRQGVDAVQLQYIDGRRKKRFDYRTDRVVDVSAYPSLREARLATLRACLEEDYDIFHFWNRSFWYRVNYSEMTGLDLPLIKARGKKIVHRFSGFDLRTPSKDLAVNPHSPFRYGLVPRYNEELQLAYLEMLRSYVDRFTVQDPELHQFMPEATIVPRALDLREWDYVGTVPTDRPLVVHAPSDRCVKGTTFILKAFEQLREEGLSFDIKLIEDMAHQEAKIWYRKADIVIDQLLIGATGVLTLEAMALGKPVVLNIREDLFRPFYDSELPFLNANPDTITDVLRGAIKDYDLRRELGEKGRQLVERHHDLRKVTTRLIELYKDVLEAPSAEPTGFGDLEWFMQKSHARFGADIVAVKGVDTMVLWEAALRRVLSPSVYQVVDTLWALYRRIATVASQIRLRRDRRQQI